MSYLSAITIFHTAISFLSLGIGAIVILGLVDSGRFPDWTKLFFWTAVVTSVTGFFFPFRGVTPAQIVGVVALVILAAVWFASHRLDHSRSWRWTYAAGLVASLYLLVFVGIVQGFQKISFLKTFAPTGTELPFVVAQGAVLLVFAALGIAAAILYRPALSGARI